MWKLFKQNRLIIRNVTVSFLLIYVINYSVTYFGYVLGINKFQYLDFELNQLKIIFEILPFIPLLALLIFILFYNNKYKLKNEFFGNNKNYISKILISIILIYFTLFLTDPFFRNFNFSMNNTSEQSWNINSIMKTELILMVLLGPILEELFFRVILLNQFLKARLIKFGIIFTSLLYAFSHIYITNSNYSIDYFNLLNLFLVGVILSSVKIRYGVLFSIISHSVMNLLLILWKNGIANLFLWDYINSVYLYFGLYIITLLSLILFLKFFFKEKTETIHEQTTPMNRREYII